MTKIMVEDLHSSPDGNTKVRRHDDEYLMMRDEAPEIFKMLCVVLYVHTKTRSPSDKLTAAVHCASIVPMMATVRYSKIERLFVCI